jgi:NAD(P)-dependent dehydrogenase (short-subunit alcohol dehydrogenase family)
MCRALHRATKMDKLIDSLHYKPIEEHGANNPRSKIYHDKFAGQVVLVSGGAQGIGKVTSQLFAAQGATVVIVDTDSVKAQNLITSLQECGTKASHYQCNVTDEEAVQAMVEMVISEFRKIDILVHLAGIYPWEALTKYPFKLYKTVMSVSVDGCFLLTRTILPYMQKQGYGRIINASSNTVQWAAGGMSAYVAAKAAIVGFTRVTAIEAGAGVTANTVAPGLIRTENTWDAKKDDPVVKSLFEMSLNRQAVKRPGLAIDVASTICFIASPEAQFITGQLFDISGGATFH